TGLSAAGASTIDADGLVALPGLVDLHTHLREPGREDAETVASGSRAAALGGYTAGGAVAHTRPAARTAAAVDAGWRARPGGWRGKRGWAACSRWGRSPWDWPASGSRSWARWPTRRRRSGSSPTTATASPTRG